MLRAWRRKKVIEIKKACIAECLECIRPLPSPAIEG